MIRRHADADGPVPARIASPHRTRNQQIHAVAPTLRNAITMTNRKCTHVR